MKTWSIYNPTDGLFTGQIISGLSSALEANLPPAMRAIEGRHDRICQRVDVETGTVVDHQPPQPHEDYEWRAENPDAVDRANQRWRWVKKPEVVEIEHRRMQSAARIAELERSQARVLREEILRPSERDPNDLRTPRERLQEIDDQIAALRVQLADRS